MREISAGAIIFRKIEGKIKYLLLYRKAHDRYVELWDFPRGLIEKKEAHFQTIKREVEEETGIKDLEFIPGFRGTSRWFYKKGDEKGNLVNVFKMVFWYLAETKTKEVKLSFEHQDFSWLEFEEAHKRLTFENSKEVLRKANSFLQKL